MIARDLRTRAERLLSGKLRVEDLDRLFLALRELSRGDQIIREIGDFVAHRAQREKGPVTQLVGDMAVSARIWFHGVAEKKLTLDDARLAATVNLRLASEDQLLNGCGVDRSTARTMLRRIFCKLDSSKRLSEKEVRLFNYLANRFIWKPCFTDSELMRSVGCGLVKNEIINSTDLFKLEAVTPFISLYVVALMHGSNIVFGDRATAELLAGFANKDHHLEVKAFITFDDWVKPVVVPLCVFWTGLLGSDYCDSNLLSSAQPWNEPLEISSNMRLSAMIGKDL